MYSTVYELDSRTLWASYIFHPGGGVELLILLAVGVGCSIYGIWRARPLYLLGTVPFLFMLSFWAPVLAGEFRWGQSLLDSYASGRCQVVEGTTRVLAQQRLEGHSIDRITIGGVQLEISHFELGPQYRDSIVYGGVLKEGVAARVWYCPQSPFRSATAKPIVRIDIKDGMPASTPSRP